MVNLIIQTQHLLSGPTKHTRQEQSKSAVFPRSHIHFRTVWLL